MKKLTAQQIHEAYVVAMPEEWGKPTDYEGVTSAAKARYEVMASWLNGQLAPQETSTDESGWYPCATAECGAQVREAGALCEACLACEELGFNVQPPREPERRHCGRCHRCGNEMHKVLDGEEWCGRCWTYRRYPSHGWSRAACSSDEQEYIYCPPLPERKAS